MSCVVHHFFSLQTKAQTKEDETSDAKKNEGNETENKEDKKDDTQSATTGPTEASQSETATNQEGDAGTSNSQQEKTDDAETTVKVENQEGEKEPVDTQSGSTQDSVKILKRGDELPEQSKPSADADLAGQESTSTDSQQLNNVSSNLKTDDPKGQSSLSEAGKHREGKKAPADAGADQYSLEPGEDDEEDNPSLIEINTRRADQAMAHNPGTMYLTLTGGGTSGGEGSAKNNTGERAVNGEGSQYHEGRPYQYGGGGYHMSTGMLEGGHHPPLALGLNPVESSMEFK